MGAGGWGDTDNRPPQLKRTSLLNPTAKVRSACLPCPTADASDQEPGVHPYWPGCCNTISRCRPFPRACSLPDLRLIGAYSGCSPACFLPDLHPPQCAALLRLLLELAASGALADAAAWLVQPPLVPRPQRRRQGRGQLPQASPDAKGAGGAVGSAGWLSGWVGEGTGRRDCWLCRLAEWLGW